MYSLQLHGVKRILIATDKDIKLLHISELTKFGKTT